mmetsp:Transcript_127350/g.271512  ORF Transcript_127350/g.271512 Transcript_127350/m.271512 type:complete len:227 (-) Transcript_127350:554-1234(-)
MHYRTILHEHVADREGRSLPHIPRVLLEGEAEHCDLLLRNGIEHCLDNTSGEGRLLVLIHIHNLLPVPRHLVQAELFADVDEVQDVLLEAGAAETYGGLEELRPDAGVRANSSGNLPYVSAGALAQPSDGVDAANTLCQHGVGHKLRELRAPEVRGEDPLAGHPVRIDVNQDLERVLDLTADEHTVGRVQILHGGALGQELRVREDVEALADSAAIRRLIGRQHTL